MKIIIQNTRDKINKVYAYSSKTEQTSEITMKGTKVQTLCAFLLCIQQKYHSLQWLFQLACNQKINKLEVFTTVLAPQNARHARLYSRWTLVG